ncbi:MAG: sugar phosphate isomerase/epimerase, partial [Oscillospiraceae bacterium]|nr:sugar phosphate isomerase/epimerase [Oscillospiraceae bacterium]
MGTPEYTVLEAIKLFHDIDIDGAEIVVQDGYRSGISAACLPEELEAVKRAAAENGIEISALTPYNSYFNDLNDELRQKEIDDICKVIDACQFLGAHYIRIYGGNLQAGDTDHLPERRQRLVEAMRFLGDKAAEKDVTLVIENHFNTMCVSARESVDMIREINHPNVRILYDQANLSFTGKEDYQEAIAVQQDYVAYMHVKDLVFKEGVAFTSDEVSHPDESKRNVYTRIVGEGVVPWPEILRSVRERGYDGWLSMEYERRWHPDDIPDAS